MTHPHERSPIDNPCPSALVCCFVTVRRGAHHPARLDSPAPPHAPTRPLLIAVAEERLPLLFSGSRFCLGFCFSIDRGRREAPATEVAEKRLVAMPT